jgi:peptide-methionine (S)-S-oxide reductase
MILKLVMKSISLFLLAAIAIPGIVASEGCSVKVKEEVKVSDSKPSPASDTALAILDTSKALEHATFAMGCFWHSEEMFLEIKGVKEALPGYSGGTKENPTYDEVGEGNTGHAESVDVTYDPSIISYQQLLEVFFTEHDPTTPNFSYPDEGPQYRSMVFYRTPAQKQQAETYIAKLNGLHTYPKPIITEIAPFMKFYRAEDYHLRYFRKHPDQPYIAHVTKGEIDKFRKDFAALLK